MSSSRAGQNKRKLYIFFKEYMVRTRRSWLGKTSCPFTYLVKSTQVSNFCAKMLKNSTAIFGHVSLLPSRQFCDSAILIPKCFFRLKIPYKF